MVGVVGSEDLSDAISLRRTIEILLSLNNDGMKRQLLIRMLTFVTLALEKALNIHLKIFKMNMVMSMVRRCLTQLRTWAHPPGEAEEEDAQQKNEKK